MKKFTKILAVCSAGLFASQTAYAIIFTGPARRQAHEQKQEEAYMAGMMAGQDINNQENDADDADVQIQAIGQEEGFGNGKFLSGLNPQQRAIIESKIKQKMHEHNINHASKGNTSDNNVTVQAYNQEGEADTALVDNAMAPKQPESEAVAQESVNTMQEQVSEKSDEKKIDTVQNDQATPSVVVEQTTEKPDEEKVTTVQQDLVNQAVDAQQAVATIDEPLQNEVTPQVIPLNEMPVAHTVSEEPLSMPKTEDMMRNEPVTQSVAVENVKIVKVYPVYEAIHAAFKSIQSTTVDMLHYVKNWLNQEKK